MAQFIPFSGNGFSIFFDAELAVKKTLKEFIAHEKHHGLTDEQYKEIHDLCKLKVNPKQDNVKNEKPGKDSVKTSEK